MENSRLVILEKAFNQYQGLIKKIEDLYNFSEEYLIPSKPECETIINDMKKYMNDIFIGIANASGTVTEEEKAFIDKFNYDDSKNLSEANSILSTTFSNIPKYIELSTSVDKLAGTNYTDNLINDTLSICKCIMDIDGNTYADESSYTYAFIDMLKKYNKNK